MRFIGRVLLASAAVLGAACSGGEKSGTTSDTSATATATPATTPASNPAATTGATGAAATGTATAKPATGKTWEVKMIGEGNTYKFDPATLTIKEGDAVKWTVVSTPPHNVAFDAATIPAAGKDQLAANMPDQQGPLSSPFLTNIGQNYTISFAGVAPGTYNYICTPHMAFGMKGTIIVQ